MDDKLAQSLGIDPVTETEDHFPAEITKGELVAGGEDREDDIDEKLETDFQYARENLYQVIEAGQNALQDLLELAGQSQHARSYEVVADLIRTLSNSSKDLVSIQQQVHKIKEDDDKARVASGKIENQNIFVGTTAELSKMFSGRGRELLKGDDD